MVRSTDGRMTVHLDILPRFMHSPERAAHAGDRALTGHLLISSLVQYDGCGAHPARNWPGGRALSSESIAVLAAKHAWGAAVPSRARERRVRRISQSPRRDRTWRRTLT